MKTVNLQGKTMKGKNCVREHGSVWVVHVITETILFNPEPGPWMYISPVGTNFQDKSARWIHQVNDQNFIVSHAKDSHMDV